MMGSRDAEAITHTHRRLTVPRRLLIAAACVAAALLFHPSTAMAAALHE